MGNVNIYALGDSITYGFPYGPRYSWVYLSCQELGVNIINGGVNGDTTACMLRRVSDAFTNNLSHLILLGGTNDAYWGQPLNIVDRNIIEICRRAEEKGIHVILGLPTPVDEPHVEALLAEYRQFLNGFAGRKGYSVIPFNKAFLGVKGSFKYELTTDGCHPNIDGYEAMAEVAEDSLRKILSV